MAIKQVVTRSNIEVHLSTLFDHFHTHAANLHTIWNSDDYDHLAANNVAQASGLGSLNALVSFATNSFERSNKEDWEDKTSMAIKARSRYYALVAQMAQTMTSGDRLPVDIIPTPESDVVEAISRQLVFTGVFDDPELARIQAGEQAREQLNRCRSRILDMIAESKVVDTWYRAIEDAVKYGVCALEAPVRRDSFARVWRTALIAVPTDESQAQENSEDDSDSLPLEQLEPMITTVPGFEKKSVLAVENISPYDIYLDPTADGDVQKGDAVIRQASLSYSDLAMYMHKPDFYHDVIKEILEADKEGTIQSGVTSFARSIQEQELSPNTKNYAALTFWARSTRKTLTEWAKEDKHVRSFIKEYDEFKKIMFPIAEEQESDYDMLDYKAITINGKLVYLSPLNTADGLRPIIYHRLMPLHGTNYGMGVYALMRPITQAMTKLWRRAVDNEVLVGTAMFTIDPSVLDMSTFQIRPGSVLKYRPGLSLAAGHMKGVGIDQVKFESVSQALMVLFDRLDMLAEEVSMVPKNMLGVTLKGDQTATESAQNYTSAQTNILRFLRSFDDAVVRRTVESFYHYMQADVRSEDNPDGITSPDETADAQVQVFGAETFMLQLLNKRMTNELLQLLPVLEQVAPGVSNTLDIPEVMRRVMKGLGFNPDEVMRIPSIAEEIAQLRQQLEQALQQIEQVQRENELGAEQLAAAAREIYSTRRELFEQKSLNDERIKNTAYKIELDRLREQLKMRNEV